MNDFTFVPVEELEAAPPLIFGLSGMSDSGKTYSALKIAKAIAEITGGTTDVIDTERRTAKYRNAKVYPELHPFRVALWEPPFNGDRLIEACQSSIRTGAGCIVVDSASDEWEGEGGVLQMQEHFLHKMAGNDFNKRDRMNMAAWAKAKTPHQRWHAFMLAMKVPIILCHRARPKIKMVKDGGKTKIVDAGIQPICDTRIVYDMMFHLLMDEEKRDGSYKVLKGGYKHERGVFPPKGRVDDAAIKRLKDVVSDGAISDTGDAPPDIETKADPEPPHLDNAPDPEPEQPDTKADTSKSHEQLEWKLGTDGDYGYKLVEGDPKTVEAKRALFDRLRSDLKKRQRTPVELALAKKIVAANAELIKGLPAKGREAIQKLIDDQGLADGETS